MQGQGHAQQHRRAKKTKDGPDIGVDEHTALGKDRHHLAAPGQERGADESQDHGGGQVAGPVVDLAQRWAGPHGASRWISAWMAGCPHTLAGWAPSVVHSAAVSASASVFTACPRGPGFSAFTSARICE